MTGLRERIRWQRSMLSSLVASRSRFLRRRDWIAFMAVYVLHAAAGSLGLRRIRCRAPLPADPEPVTIRLGTADFHVVKEVHLHQVYAFAIPALTSLTPPIATVVDLGANIGLTVRLWSRLFAVRAIVAVEPDADNLALCAANAGPAASGSLTLFECFVGDAAGVAHVDRALGTWAYRMARDGDPADTRAVAVRTLPEILAEAQLDGVPIDLLKCDIEGAEADLFRGGPPWLRQVRAVLAEVHHPYTPEALVADVRAAGHWDVTVDGSLVLLVRRQPDSRAG